MKHLESEELGAFLRKKGILYKGSEIYGGVAGVYDWGHIGALLKRNWIREWRRHFLRHEPQFVEIDCSHFMAEQVFQASGHVDNFFDPIAYAASGSFIRADTLIESELNMDVEGKTCEEMLEIIQEHNLKAPDKTDIVEVKTLNLMLPLGLGPGEKTKVFLRGESAQGPYVNFKQQYEVMRKKMPLGIAMIGRVFRNEISPRNLVLRGREFEQAELQIFFNPDTYNDKETYEATERELPVLLHGQQEISWIPGKELVEKNIEGMGAMYAHYLEQVYVFFVDILGVPKDAIRLKEIGPEKRAFYNRCHMDIEVFIPSFEAWTEVAGVHYRGDHDLSSHQKHSKQSMEVFDEATRSKYIPHVLELSFGLSRCLLMMLSTHTQFDTERDNTVIRVPSYLSPYTIAVFPLVNKMGLDVYAKNIFDTLVDQDIPAQFDKSGSIGRRYARQDEQGTFLCVTVDFDTITEGELQDTVTVRFRDTGEQQRVSIEQLHEMIRSCMVYRK